jgi:hypothetical protein
MFCVVRVAAERSTTIRKETPMSRNLSAAGQLLVIVAVVSITWALASTQRSEAQSRRTGSDTDHPTKDTDGDGVPNAEDSDDDNDGLTDKFEAQLGTNPQVADSDGDGISDSDEVSGPAFDPETGMPVNTDPNNDDGDNDGWTDGEEIKRGSDPHNPDSTPAPHTGPHHEPTD